MSEKPSSLVHYTSLATLSSILNNAMESGILTFHLSHLYMMNDANEGKLILDNYFTESNKKTDQKIGFEDYISNNIPFIMSLSRSSNDTRHYGLLPMWKMYGDNFTGCMLRFDYKRLNDYIGDINDSNIELNKCDYKNSVDIAKAIKDLNDSKIAPDYSKLLRTAAFSKYHTWEYENEWRIMIIEDTKNVLYKFTNNGIIEYCKFEIPLTCLKEIMLGPLTNVYTKKSVIDQVALIKTKYDLNNKISITKSKIAIQ